MSNESSRRTPARDAERRGGNRAARRAAFDDRRRTRRDVTRRRHAAVALHHVERHANAILARARSNSCREIPFDDRRERRIDDGRRKAFVLAVLRIDLRRNGNARVREALRERLRRRAARARRWRTREADRSLPPRRFAIVQRRRRRGRARRRRVVRPLRRYGRSVRHRQAVILARDQRPRASHEKIVDFAAILTPDFDHVAKAFGRDQRDARQTSRPICPSSALVAIVVEWPRNSIAGRSE